MLVLTQSGCTYALWTDQTYQGYHQPAPNSGLHLYQSKKPDDILVVYREQSESNEHVRTRAYWLNKNQIRVTHDSPPDFISQKKDRNLPAVPVFDSMPTNESAMPHFFALSETNQSFKLFSGEREVGSYHLPAYQAQRPVGEKVALTPVTMTADAAIAAAIAGIVILCLWASSQSN